MIARATPRGQPLLALGLLLGGWVVLRAALWNGPATPPPTLDEISGFGSRVAKADRSQSQPPTAAIGLIAPTQGWPILSGLPDLEPRDRSPVKERASFPVNAALYGNHPPLQMRVDDAWQPDADNVPDPAPLSLAAAPFQAPQYRLRPPVKRWSGDAWLLMRGDGTGNIAAGRGSYGASQAGAVLRFAVLPGSSYRPAVYLRGSKAISGAGEAEGALGVSARPAPGVPLRVAAELRVSETSGKAELRPAAYVVTELPPVELPLAFRGEAYAQGGYVGGGYPSAFVDGQLRVDRAVATLGRMEIRAGGGIWGGAQRGAERLDVGPGATLALDTGPANARVSVDWRQRIAGDARPASGPALTVSVGF